MASLKTGMNNLFHLPLRFETIRMNQNSIAERVATTKYIPRIMFHILSNPFYMMSAIDSVQMDKSGMLLYAIYT
jgi:hypothetical protein